MFIGTLIWYTLFAGDVRDDDDFLREDYDPEL